MKRAEITSFTNFGLMTDLSLYIWTLNLHSMNNKNMRRTYNHERRRIQSVIFSNQFLFLIDLLASYYIQSFWKRVKRFCIVS